MTANEQARNAAYARAAADPAFMAEMRAMCPGCESAARSAPAGVSDSEIVNRLEWADTVLLCHEDEDDPARRYSFRDMATPPTAENPDGTIYGPTVRAVVSAAIAASRGQRAARSAPAGEPDALREAALHVVGSLYSTHSGYVQVSSWAMEALRAALSSASRTEEDQRHE